jgi:hypothetical protein
MCIYYSSTVVLLLIYIKQGKDTVETALHLHNNSFTCTLIRSI